MEVARLPEVECEKKDLLNALTLIQETHQRRARRYRELANRGSRDQGVRVGSLLWVKKETVNHLQKLNIKWDSHYRVV